MNKKKDISKKKKIKSNNGFFQKLSKQLKNVFSGNVLVEGLEANNLRFMFFITGLMIFYIGYGYYVDSTIKERSKQEEIGSELYSELQSAKELYNKKSLQSKVAEEMEEAGLFESIDPPTAIEFEIDNTQNEE